MDEQDGGALRGREEAKRTTHLVAQRHVAGKVRRGDATASSRSSSVGSGARPPQPLQAGGVRDAIEPGAHTGLAAELRQAAIGVQVGSPYPLVLLLTRAQQMERKCTEVVVVAVDEPGEGAVVAAPSGPDHGGWGIAPRSSSSDQLHDRRLAAWFTAMGASVRLGRRSPGVAAVGWIPPLPYWMLSAVPFICGPVPKNTKTGPRAGLTSGSPPD